jgi:hypothetical protein
VLVLVLVLLVVLVVVVVLLLHSFIHICPSTLPTATTLCLRGIRPFVAAFCCGLLLRPFVAAFCCCSPAEAPISWAPAPSGYEGSLS